MNNLHVVLYLFAIVCFVLAAFPSLTSPRPVQLQYLAAALLVLTLVI